MFNFLKFQFGLSKVSALIFLAVWAFVPASAQQGLRGDDKAIADARAMVQAMGGLEVWAQLKSVHFVHEWDLANRPDRYLEHEILDMTGPRSYVTMKSEGYSRTRAYSPEHRYWNIVNDEFSYANESSFERAISRAPYSIYRLAVAIGKNDPNLKIEAKSYPEIPRAPALQFTFGDGEPGGWIILNARKEPMLWATTQYAYAFGPLERFGNLWVPNWANSSAGMVRYEMVSLEGSTKAPDMALFTPPETNAPG